MPLPMLSILQVGDVHWPELSRSAGILDDKDSGFPAAIKSHLSMTPQTAVKRRLISILPQQDAVLLVGDFTERGDLGHYEAFLDVLRQWVEDYRLDKVHVVSGNHDVNHADADDSDLYGKFAPLNRALQARNFLPLPADTPRITGIGSREAAALIVALNSCVGCGVQRHINSLQLATANGATKVQTDELTDELYERLDTPAFDVEHLTQTVDAIRGAGEKVLPVVFAHHNLLPQAITRIAPYTELINSGLARGHLASLNRPVIYLHGHIHTDPIEVVLPQQRRLNKARIISISAPELKDGFNVLKITYNPKGYAIGCTIEKWRYDPNEQLLLLEEERIPLWGSGMVALEQMSTEARKLYDEIPKDDVRVDDLFTESKAQSLETMVDLLKELQWFGLVRLEDSDADIHCWNVRGKAL
ncbi:MAG: metallophosphoesterase family protein [Symbiobacteriia bacterium]